MFALPFACAIGSCTDPYAFQTRNFESVLVVEASLTNQLKHHAIKVSRTHRLEEDGPNFETGANVYVEDDLGNIINFGQQDTMYVSETEFAPDPERTYKLHVTTSDGNSYSSTPEKQTPVNVLDDLTAINVNIGEAPGVQIVANAYDPTGNSRYYRYEYEEAGRFSVPYHSDSELVIYPDDLDADAYQEWALEPRTEEARTCFIKGSKKNIMYTTQGLAQDRVENFALRSIADTVYQIHDRYGIRVRQYVQNLASYNFYKTMEELGSIGNILSQNQPGFFYGNIRNDNNPNEKVIGFFEVSTVSEKTLFFNYNDIFPGTIPPAWPYECVFQTYFQDAFENFPFSALQMMAQANAGVITYYQEDPAGNFVFVSDQCGDCRKTGSNTVPDFWQD